jgi:hypothetical protein
MSDLLPFMLPAIIACCIGGIAASLIGGHIIVTFIIKILVAAICYMGIMKPSNADIRRYNFYNPKNIFIFGIDSTEFLKEFVKSPVDKIPEQIRQQYDINTWIDQYLP